MICKLLDIVNTVNTGADAIKKAPIVDEPTGLRCLRIGDVSQKRDFSAWGYTRTTAADYERYKLHKGDSIIARTGNTIGVSIYIEKDIESVYNNGLIRITAKREVVSPPFLYYLIRSTECQDYIQSIAYGTSTQPNMKIKDFLNFDINLPSLEVQDKIIAIIDKIEKKIRTNSQINENLSDLLQAIYQEQFSNVSLSENQGILSDICSYSKAKVAVSELNTNTYFSTENMLPGKAGSIEATSLPAMTRTTACHKGDTLISNIRPYFKKIVYCEDVCGCSSDVLCFTPVQFQYAAYLFSTLYTDKFFTFMVAGSKGTKMPRGDKQQIMTYPLILPSEKELEEFNAVAVPVLEQLNYNRTENKRLSALRDALLPKLMSGELDVSALDF